MGRPGPDTGLLGHPGRHAPEHEAAEETSAMRAEDHDIDVERRAQAAAYMARLHGSGDGT